VNKFQLFHWQGSKPFWCGSQIIFGDLKSYHLTWCFYNFYVYSFLWILWALCLGLDFMCCKWIYLFSLEMMHHYGDFCLLWCVCEDNGNFRCQHGNAWHLQLGCHGGLIDLIANDSNHMIVASTWVGIDDIWHNLLNQNMHSINNIKSHPNKLCHGSKLVKVYQWWQKWHTP
jgi:hypothetical protein